jgi:hypothetical protein
MNIHLDNNVSPLRANIDRGWAWGLSSSDLEVDAVRVAAEFLDDARLSEFWLHPAPLMQGLEKCMLVRLRCARHKPQQRPIKKVQLVPGCLPYVEDIYRSCDFG